MINNEALDIAEEFLDDMDRFIAENLQNLKCKDISDIYSQFTNYLREFRGTSSGFTGLSEFLIFRCLYYQLGGKLLKKKAVTKDIYEFSNGNIRIGQSQSIPVTMGKRQPDITIYHSNELIAVIQIKVYLGMKEVDKEIETLKALKEQNQKLRALLIIFSLSKKGTIYQALLKEQQNKEWFNFLILEGNNELLMQKLQHYLGLEGITAASPNSG
jgi:hypothetical protein